MGAHTFRRPRFLVNLHLLIKPRVKARVQENPSQQLLIRFTLAIEVLKLLRVPEVDVWHFVDSLFIKVRSLVMNFSVILTLCGERVVYKRKIIHRRKEVYKKGAKMWERGAMWKECNT